MQLATTNLVPRVLSYPPWERGWQQPDLLQDRFERGWENAQQNNLYVLVTRFTLDLPFFRCLFGNVPNFIIQRIFQIVRNYNCI